MKTVVVITLLLIAFNVWGGTRFEDGEKVEVCQGSTCGPDNGAQPSPSPGTVVTINQGGTISLSSQVVSATAPRSHTVRSVGVAPDIVANPTAPCRVAIGASGGWIGGALGITGSTLDEGCDARADATMLLALGLEDVAVARLCQKREMAKALGPLCPAVEPAAPTGWAH